MTLNNIFDIAQQELLSTIVASKDWLIMLDDSKGHMPAGNNGPHYALETPVRNTAHWLIAYIVADQLEILPNSYKNIITYLRNWLINDNPHYKNGWYVMRQKGFMDWSNGVIGPSWVLEALIRLNKYYNDDEAYQRVNEIYSKHAFCQNGRAWKRYDTVNRRYGLDSTLDHQAWFAASAVECGNINDTQKFLDRCYDKGMRIRIDGRISHLFYTNTAKNYINRIQFKIAEIRQPKTINDIETAYQIYTIFPFARIYKYLPEHKLFKTEKFKKALDFCTYENLKKTKNSTYGYSYNAPGFELPLVHSIFSPHMPITTEEVLKIFYEQLEYTKCKSNELHTRNTKDPYTLSARIYELALFLETQLDNENT
jgi:hypothetical protein